MYFDVYVNELKVATVGPSDLEHLSVSVSAHNGALMLMANGLSSAEPGQRYFTWLDDDLAAADIVRVVPSEAAEATPPRKVRNLRRGQKATEQDRFCDFCKQSESEVGSVVQAGDTPFICAKCAELCLEILQDRDNDA
jgi:hypothetical protein